MSAKQKAQALVAAGECADMGDAACYLLDMGEISQSACDKLAAKAATAAKVKAANAAQALNGRGW